MICATSVKNHGLLSRDFPMHNHEYKDYVKDGGDKDKRMDVVLDKKGRKVAADSVVKKALAV